MTEVATGESLARRLRELVQHTAVYGLETVVGQVAAFLLRPLYTNLLSPARSFRLLDEHEALS